MAGGALALTAPPPLAQPLLKVRAEQKSQVGRLYSLSMF